jgi:predicted nucleic acid-binding protein
MYLLDTNTIIYYLKGALHEKAMQQLHTIVDEQPLISVITKLELLGFNAATVEEQTITEIFIDASLIFNLDEAVIIQTIELRKQYRIKLPDAIIAATAIVYNLILVTHNTTDFDKIQALKCIDPNLF